jgi:hypothetical protein
VRIVISNTNNLRVKDLKSYIEKRTTIREIIILNSEGVPLRDGQRLDFYKVFTSTTIINSIEQGYPVHIFKSSDGKTKTSIYSGTTQSYVLYNFFLTRH